MDFGYVVNTAPTTDQEVYNSTYHDEFVIEVELQMSDHTFTEAGAVNTMYLSMTFGDVVVIRKSLDVFGEVYVMNGHWPCPNKGCKHNDQLT